MRKVVFECTVCSTERTPKSEWVMAELGSYSNSKEERVNFFPWDEKMEEDDDVAHLCSSDCRSKYLERSLDGFKGDPSRRIKPEIPPVFSGDPEDIF